MKNLKNKIKNMKGITLISLVITIVVIIILAGITVILLGENGIINKTKTATKEHVKATATETMNLKITNVQISKYAEEQRMPTLKELADDFCEDNDFQYVQETSKVASLTKIANANPTSIYTKLKAYPYEFEINSSLQLASIDGVKVASVPDNDNDTIISMTKSELDSYIENAINTKLQKYSTTKDISSTYATKNQIEKYSTDEIQIGTWINNKPLYRKVVTLNGERTTGVKTYTIDIPNVDYITVNENHSFIYATTPEYIPIKSIWDTGITGGYTILPNANNIKFQWYRNLWQHLPATITFEYTKTTD